MAEDGAGAAPARKREEPAAAEKTDLETRPWRLARYLDRPLASEEGHFIWNMHRVPRTLPDGAPHPCRISAIFVVHGIGNQHSTETAAHLRAGFEDAFELIADWQQKNLPKSDRRITLGPPFVFEGFWADYDDLAVTFPEDFARFNRREKDFFGNLWKQRVISGARTFFWFLNQQGRLLHPRVLWAVGPFAWLLYWPLQLVSLVTLLVAWLRRPAVVSNFLNDVRLYLDPRGVVERAIVHSIDDRVERRFLSTIGLDRDFRPLAHDQRIEAGGERFVFDRIVWVAHSLGTVVSYNVLSDLFHRAAQLQHSGDDKQKAGVARFRSSLSRFVTLGSPLDKVAFLFGSRSLRRWPVGPRRSLLISGENVSKSNNPSDTEWWVNFYHVFDPVSGALHSPFLCRGQVPLNIHASLGTLPGLAHVSYWHDAATLRYILGRTYGAGFLKDQEYRPRRPWVLGLVAVLGYFTWAAILGLSLYLLFHWGPALLRGIGHSLVKWITG